VPLTPEEVFEGGTNVYGNWIALGVGSFWPGGNKAQAEALRRASRSVFGGVEDFRYQKMIDKSTLTIDGRALFDQNDYKRVSICGGKTSATCVLPTTNSAPGPTATAVITPPPANGTRCPTTPSHWTAATSLLKAFSCLYYRADNYEDNSSFGVPYGAGAEDHSVSAGVTRRIRDNIRLFLCYGYSRYTDETFGGNEDYHAHVVSCAVRYLF
jgi:hypothetical protein